jgi:hypothetical protein
MSAANAVCRYSPPTGSSSPRRWMRPPSPLAIENRRRTSAASSSAPSGSTPATQRATPCAVSAGVVSRASAARISSVSASSIPASAALATRAGVIARVMTRACVAVMAPEANASAVAGSCASRRPVETIAVASLGARWHEPRSHAFMETAPSTSWAWRRSAARTADVSAAVNRFTDVAHSATSSSSSASESAAKSTLASPSSTERSSDTSPSLRSRRPLRRGSHRQRLPGSCSGKLWTGPAPVDDATGTFGRSCFSPPRRKEPT